MKGDETGWWDVEAHDTWTCPECLQSSPAVEWLECEVDCEDCGSHEARKCPNCDEAFDHVWGSSRIEQTTANT
jgi:hypothetical protein